MIPFLVGLVMGAAFACCGFVLFAARREEKNPVNWSEEFYQPPVTTRLLIKERTFEL